MLLGHPEFYHLTKKQLLVRFVKWGSGNRGETMGPMGVRCADRCTGTSPKFAPSGREYGLLLLCAWRRVLISKRKFRIQDHFTLL